MGADDWAALDATYEAAQVLDADREARVRRSAMLSLAAENQLTLWEEP